MIDRQPSRPGRVKITPEDGSPAFYGTMEMADEPVELGTPLNKETLLSDVTGKLFGFNPQDGNPDKAIAWLYNNVSKLNGFKDGLITIGKYIGTADSVHATPVSQNIVLGFEPDVLLFSGSLAKEERYGIPPELTMLNKFDKQHCIVPYNGVEYLLKLNATGFAAGGGSAGGFNYSGRLYTYVAFKEVK